MLAAACTSARRRQVAQLMRSAVASAARRPSSAGVGDFAPDAVGVEVVGSGAAAVTNAGMDRTPVCAEVEAAGVDSSKKRGRMGGCMC